MHLLDLYQSAARSFKLHQLEARDSKPVVAVISTVTEIAANILAVVR